MWNETVWMLAGVMVLFLAGSAAGQAQPGWSDQFATGDLNGGIVRCMTAFDEDGPGPGLPSLFAGGSFRTAGVDGPWVAAIARWDGIRWTDVGGSADLWFGDSYYGVDAMVVFDEDGPGPNPESLYVAGRGFQINGQTGVFRWDGVAWTRVCAPPCNHPVGPVYDLAVFDEDGPGPGLPRLFAAGRIETGIWCWNGTQWSPTDESVYVTGGQVNALAVFDEDGLGPLLPALYAGGDFRWWYPTAPLQVCAKWDGNTWSQVGDGLSGRIEDLAFFDPDGDYPGQGHLYAAGSINVPGLPPSADLLRWDGEHWSAFDMSEYSYAGHLSVGDIDGDGPVPNSLISDAYGWEESGTALWDGFGWTVLQNDFYWDSVWPTSFGIFDDDRDGGRSPTFFVGGGFWSGPDGVRGITQWNGQNIVGIGNGVWRGMQGIRSIDSDGPGGQNPKLYAVGSFVAAGDSMARTLAVWDGEKWEPVGGLNELIDLYAVEEHSTDESGSESRLLVVGGSFNHIAGEQSANVAAWDGSQWSSLASSMTHRNGWGTRVNHLLSFDDDGDGPGSSALYAAGSFTSIDGVACVGLARWDGLTWSSVGEGLDGLNGVEIASLEFWDADPSEQSEPLLVVGGSFDKAGSIPVTGIAVWDGDTWSRVGDALSGQVDSMAVVEEGVSGGPATGLYVSGSMTYGDGRILQGIMKLENGTWSLIGGRKLSGSEWLPVGGLTSAGARAMKSLDPDDSGGLSASLFILGWAIFEDDSQSYAMARWDGQEWSPVGNFAGYSPYPYTMEVFDEDGEGSHPPGLFVAGRFNSVDGIQSVGIARWGLRVPYIVRQPGDLRRGVGDSALFNVKAGGGDTLSFQWRLDGSDLVDDDRHSGANTETLRISNLHLADRGQYEVVITNSAGIKTSRAAQLDVFCNSSRITPDLNHDRAVNGHDVQSMVDALLSLATSDAGLCTADLNGDLELDSADVELLVESLIGQ